MNYIAHPHIFISTIFFWLKRCLLLFITLTLIHCSNVDDTTPTLEQEDEVTDPPEPPKFDVDPNKVITIDTDALRGDLYNLWSTRPMINQTRFLSKNFVSSLSSIKSYVKSYNLVRLQGGRLDDKNTVYKGVDEDGKIITDFSELRKSMRAVVASGFEPRIVLDNVPWQMSAKREENVYGNTNPPADYNLWRQYIKEFLTVLIDEFGYDQVKGWRFRVGKEPNYTPQHWNGTPEEFFKHYDITVDEVTKIIPEAVVGPGNLLTEGVATFTTEIIDHCANGTNYATGEIGTQMGFF